MMEKMQTSDFIYVRKITNMAEDNYDTSQHIHQNEGPCNFFAHQVTVTLQMEELYYSWHF